MGTHKNVPKNEEKKKILLLSDRFLVNNEFLFKRTSYRTKKMWIKVCKKWSNGQSGAMA